MYYNLFVLLISLCQSCVVQSYNLCLNSNKNESKSPSSLLIHTTQKQYLYNRVFLPLESRLDNNLYTIFGYLLLFI